MNALSTSTRLHHAVAGQSVARILLAVIASIGVRCSPPRTEVRPESITGGQAPPLRKAGLTLADRGPWRAVLQWPETCEGAFQATHVGGDPGLEFHEILERVFLVAVTCAAGSYQPSMVYVRFDERHSPPVAQLLTFPIYASADGESLAKNTANELWGEPTVGPAARELTVLSLSRQTGDCGIWSRFAIGEGTPQLVETRYRLPCPARPGIRATPSTHGQSPRGWALMKR